MPTVSVATTGSQRRAEAAQVRRSCQVVPLALAALPMIMAALGVSSLLVTAGCGASSTNTPADAAQASDPALRIELLARAKRKEDLQRALFAKGSTQPDLAVFDQMTANDGENAQRMADLIEQRGWPDARLAGKDGGEAAVRLMQDAPLPLQEKVLPLVTAAYKKGEVSADLYAQLEDRVRVGQGKPQLYGSQASLENGEFVVQKPVEDEANLDARRAQLGLAPVSEHLKELKARYLPPEQPVENPALRAELLDRVEKDQAIRNELIDKDYTKLDPDVMQRMRAIDAENTRRIAQIIEQHGWPSPRLVGPQGSEAAFLLVQHAELPLQQKVLPLVEAAYRKGELRGESYALLLDRVLIGEGKKQVYGSQTLLENGEFIARPIEDADNVDKRRAELGMMPLAEYLQALKEMYLRSTKSPQ